MKGPAGVHQKEDGQFPFFHELFDVGMPRPGRHVPINGRTSSPGIYSRTSENSIPRPLNVLEYCPAKVSFTNRRAVISSFRTRLRTSAVVGGVF
jgi:hypothetical protein